MSSYHPIIVCHPLDSDIRLIQIGPGYDPAGEPLLSHTGLLCDLGGRVDVAMNGVTTISDKTRQFLTTVDNDMREDVLLLLSEEFNDPARRNSKIPIVRAEADRIRRDLDRTPTAPQSLLDLLEPAPTAPPTRTEPDDTPEL